MNYLRVNVVMRILLTGASGFIGAHLALRLYSEAHEVFVLPSPHFRPARLARAGYTAVTHPAEARAEVVYHLASTPMSAAIPDREHEAVILGGTRLLVEQLSGGQAPPRRLIFAGSAAEYGSGHDWREEDVARPDSAFGRLKRAAAELIAGSRIPSVHLRIFTPYGEGEAPTRLIPTAARAALTGEPVRLASDGSQTRDYFHVTDLVDALVEAARRPLDPGVAINVCSGRPRRVVDVARRLIDLAGSSAPLEPGPPEPAAPLTRSSGNTERAARLLAWRPRIAFDAGLGLVLESIRKEQSAA